MLAPKAPADAARLATPDQKPLPVLIVQSWEEPFSAELEALLMLMMPDFLQGRRWYLGQGRLVRFVELLDIIAMPESSGYVLLLRGQYASGEPDIYTLPLSVATGSRAEEVMRNDPEFVVARLAHADGTSGVLYSALRDPQFGISVLNAIARRRRMRGTAGEIYATHTRAFREIWGSDRPHLEPAPVRGEHNHSALTFGERFFMKLFRKVEHGRNPELEVEQFLAERSGFRQVPRIAGWLEYRSEGEESITLAVLQNQVHAESTGWEYTMDWLGLFFERALAGSYDLTTAPEMETFPLSLQVESPPSLVSELMGDYAEMVSLLGRRTAEMHTALASPTDDPAFAPEPFTDFYRQSLYHGMVALAMRCFEQLHISLPNLPEPARSEAETLLGREAEVRARFQALRDRRLNALRIRHHGDYHLGQVLHTGKDFVVIDFEGDPNLPIGQRRIKRSPLRDVASMLRSLHYAAHSALYGQIPGVVPRDEAAGQLRAWVEFWTRWANAMFLSGYLGTAGKARFLPERVEDLRVLLDCYLLERALRELRHELSQRQEWVRIPVHGILEILGATSGPAVTGPVR